MGLFGPFLAFLFFVAGQFVIFLIMHFGVKHATLRESRDPKPIISPSPLINVESELCQDARLEIMIIKKGAYFDRISEVTDCYIAGHNLLKNKEISKGCFWSI